MPIDRRVVARDDDAVFRRRLRKLVVLAVLATGAAFLLLHFTGVLKRG